MKWEVHTLGLNLRQPEEQTFSFNLRQLEGQQINDDDDYGDEGDAEDCFIYFIYRQIKTRINHIRNCSFKNALCTTSLTD